MSPILANQKKKIMMDKYHHRQESHNTVADKMRERNCVLVVFALVEKSTDALQEGGPV